MIIIVAISLIIPKPTEAISMRGSPTTATTASGTSIAPTKPAGTAVGDILIAEIGASQRNAAFTATGWTSILHITDGGSNFTLEVYYRVVDGTEGGSFTFSHAAPAGRLAGAVMAYKGVDTANIFSATGTSSIGTDNSPVATTATTTAPNTLVIAAYAMDNANTRSFTPPSGMTEKVDLAIDNGGLFNAISIGLSEVAQPATGATGTKTATASGTGNWGAFLFAMNPLIPGVSQSAYRFLSNLDVANSEYIQSNPSVGSDDSIRGVSVDSANGFMYIGGSTGAGNWLVQKRRLTDGSLDTAFTYPTPLAGTLGAIAVFPTDNSIFVVGLSGGQQKIEKRRMSDGALCTAANCGTLFGTAGVISPGFSGSANDVDIDTVNGHIYVGGFETSGDDYWRVGKYRTDTGAAVAAFTQTADGCTSRSGTVCDDSSTGNDRVRTVAVDSQNGYIYAGGWDIGPGGTDTEWRMEKRRTSDGALCTAANCGTAFDTDGIYITDPNTTTDDQLLTFQVDTAGNAIFLGGFDANGSPANTNEWRLQKLNAATGALCTAANCGTAFDTDGILTYDSATSSTNDQLLDLDLDDAGGFLYTTGQDAGTSAADLEWRIEKRRRDTGALDSAFGTSGVVSVNPSTANPDSPARIAVDLPRNFLYTSGGDRTISGTDQQWRVQKFDLDTGGIWLDTPQDTAAVASTNISFRLRLLLHVSTNDMIANGATYKLQYAPKVGTCDTGFVDEIYTDVTSSSTEVRYHDNPDAALTDGSNLTGVTGDPTHSGHTVVNQTYEELNDFTNPTTDVPNGQDGRWEFVMEDNNAFGAYCFRVVESDGDPLASYSVVPELSFCRNEPTTDKLLRHGTYFCSGVKRAFFWAL